MISVTHAQFKYIDVYATRDKCSLSKLLIDSVCMFNSIFGVAKLPLKLVYYYCSNWTSIECLKFFMRVISRTRIYSKIMYKNALRNYKN